jgi:hypothetical protein
MPHGYSRQLLSGRRTRLSLPGRLDPCDAPASAAPAAQQRMQQLGSPDGQRRDSRALRARAATPFGDNVDASSSSRPCQRTAAAANRSGFSSASKPERRAATGCRSLGARPRPRTGCASGWRGRTDRIPSPGLSSPNRPAGEPTSRDAARRAGAQRRQRTRQRILLPQRLGRRTSRACRWYRQQPRRP